MDFDTVTPYVIIFLMIIGIYFYKTHHPIFRLPRNNLILSIFKSGKLDDSTNTNSSVNAKNLEFQRGAPIDLNNTGKKAVFMGGSRGEPDQLLQETPSGEVVDVIDQTNLSSNSATYSAVSVDLDYNGLTDLIVAREDGVTLYLNHGKGKFEKRKILSASRDTIPVSLAISDYNKDGHVDVYVSQFVHPALADKAKANRRFVSRNVLLEGLGTGAFEDVTDLIGDVGLGNTVNSQFVDLNNDRIPDLVLTKDTGEVEVYQGTRGASGDKFVSGFKFIKRGKASPPSFWKSVARSLPDKMVWENVHGAQQMYSGQNYVNVRLPQRVPFLNSTVTVISINDKINKQRTQSKQAMDGAGMIPFALGDDDRILYLMVRTIYDNKYVHPYPKINTTASFRDAKL